MPCKLCRFAYACRALRKDDMGNTERIKNIIINLKTKIEECLDITDETEASYIILSECKCDAENLQALSELEQAEPLEYQTWWDKEGRKWADNSGVGKFDIGKVVWQYRQKEIDRQAAEIKRLKEQNEILKNKYQVLVYVLCSDIDVACQEARPCTVDNLRDYIGFALDIARQYGLSETIKDKKQALKERK